MTISMHGASVGVFSRLLRNLDGLLARTETWVAERRIDPSAILGARLAPDMYAFTRQVQIMTDMVKGTCARLAGIDAPRFEDNEASLGELRARVKKTQEFISGLQPSQFEGSETRAISLKLGPPGAQTELNFNGLDYLLTFGTPNVYFHYTMVYALLRHNGLQIGKRDY